jgi:hypothetical protein
MKKEIAWNEETTCAEAFSFMMECANAKFPMIKIPHVSFGVTTAIANFRLGLGVNYRIEEHASNSQPHTILHAAKPVEIPQRHITVHVPAGIGDIAWVMMKLQQALGPNGTCDLLVSGEGPKRGREFAELYPCVRDVKYSDVGYQVIHQESRATDKASLEAAFLNNEPIYLSANSHLELGNRIETYLPHYPVRYDLHNLEHLAYKGPTIDSCDFNIGIYPSSYKTNKEWNCGDPEAWCVRIRDMYNYFRHIFPHRKVKFFLIGAVFDRRFAAEIMRLLVKEKFNHVINTVGHLHISSTIQLIYELSALISFPSGIGIIGSMIGTPTVMMMPTHLRLMEYKWVDPDLISQDRFIQLQLDLVNERLLDVVCDELNCKD